MSWYMWLLLVWGVFATLGLIIVLIGYITVLRAQRRRSRYSRLHEDYLAQNVRCPSLQKIYLSIFDPAQIGEWNKELIGQHCARCSICGSRYDLLIRSRIDRYMKQVTAEGARAAKRGSRDLRPE